MAVMAVSAAIMPSLASVWTPEAIFAKSTSPVNQPTTPPSCGRLLMPARQSNRAEALVKASSGIACTAVKNPVVPASGTFGYGNEYKDFYDINILGSFSFKGTTREARFGNPSAVAFSKPPSGKVITVLKKPLRPVAMALSLTPSPS